MSVNDALSSLAAALGKRVDLVGDQEWLPGCEPSVSVETGVIDCDPEPEIIDLADPSTVRVMFDMNRREYRAYSNELNTNRPEDDQGRKLHQINAISKAIGKERLTSGVNRLNDFNS